MNRFKMYLLAASGIAILALTITLLNTSHAGAQQAAKIGPPPKPPTPVDVVQSDITLPVFDIDNARQPFQASVLLNLRDNNLRDLETIAMVPNDKRLVIEYISARGFLSGNNCFFSDAQLQTAVANGGVQSHHFGMNLQGNEAGDFIFLSSQQARLYADPGTTVRAQAERFFCTGGLQVTISGYLVDVAQFQEIP